MKKTVAFILAAVMLFVLSACSKTETHHPEGVELVADKCSLVDAVQKGDTVTYYCSLTIENTTAKTAAVKLAANFPDEYKDGKYAIDFSVAKVDGSEMVAVPAAESVTVDAVFEIAVAAKHSGETLDINKELPAISINEIEIDSELLPPTE